MYTIGPLRVEVSKRLKKIKINKKTLQLGWIVVPPQVISLRPYITVTHGLLLPGEPDQIIARAAPQLRRCNHQFVFWVHNLEGTSSINLVFGSSTIDVNPSRSEMVGKMVNGTGLTDDRRVSEQVRLESENYILNSSKGLAQRDR